MIAFVRRKLANLFSDQRFADILTGSLWTLVAKVLAIGFAMVSSVFIARFYGAGVMGILALINSIVTLATMVSVMGTKTSILRLIPEHLKKYSTASASRVYHKTQFLVIGVSLGVGALLLVSSHWIAGTALSKPHLSTIFAVASCFVVARAIMDLNISAVRGVQLNRVFALMQLLPEFARLLILLVATYIAFTPNVPVYALLASWVITAATGIIIMERAFKKRMSASGPVTSIPVKSILALSLPMLLTTSMAFIIGRSGVVILGIFRPEADVGYYSTAVTLAGMTSFVFESINSIVAGKFSELYHSNKMDDLFHVARKSTKLMFWAAAPILLLFIALGRPLLIHLYGQHFSAAYPPLLIMAIGQFVNAVTGSTGMFMNMTGHQIRLRNIMVVAAALNVIINLVLTPVFGMIGAALAAMVSVASWNIYVLVFIKRTYGQSLGYLPFFAK